MVIFFNINNSSLISFCKDMLFLRARKNKVTLSVMRINGFSRIAVVEFKDLNWNHKKCKATNPQPMIRGKLIKKISELLIIKNKRTTVKCVNNYRKVAKGVSSSTSVIIAGLVLMHYCNYYCCFVWVVIKSHDKILHFSFSFITLRFSSLAFLILLCARTTATRM